MPARTLDKQSYPRDTEYMHLTEATRVEHLRDGDTFQHHGTEYLLLTGYRVDREDETRCLTVSRTDTNFVEDMFLGCRTVVLVHREQLELSR